MFKAAFILKRFTKLRWGRSPRGTHHLECVKRSAAVATLGYHKVALEINVYIAQLDLTGSFIL